MPQLVIIAERVTLGQPGDGDPNAPVIGGFEYAPPGPDVEDFAINVHDVHVDKELGSYANVSVLYVLPDEVDEDDAIEGEPTLTLVDPTK